MMWRKRLRTRYAKALFVTHPKKNEGKWREEVSVEEVMGILGIVELAEGDVKVEKMTNGEGNHEEL